MTLIVILAIFCMLLAAYNAAKDNVSETVLGVGYALINVLIYGFERML